MHSRSPIGFHSSEQREWRYVVFNIEFNNDIVGGGIGWRPLLHVVPQSGGKVARHCSLQSCQKDPQSCWTCKYTIKQTIVENLYNNPISDAICVTNRFYRPISDSNVVKSVKSSNQFVNFERILTSRGRFHKSFCIFLYRKCLIPNVGGDETRSGYVQFAVHSRHSK